MIYRGIREAGFTASLIFSISRKEISMEIPFWNRYTLTVEEAAQYFRIGENKLRKIINDNKDADYILWNGTRPQIKRTKFEEYVDGCKLI